MTFIQVAKQWIDGARSTWKCMTITEKAASVGLVLAAFMLITIL
jgi:hypothetical protein